MKQIDDKENVYNHYLDKQSDIMKNTQMKAEDVFGNSVGKESISLEQIPNFNNF